MERWLTKPRVLLALSGFLLMAALNRSDPFFYGMFLFLLTLALLGLGLPWLSLRRVSVDARGQGEVFEQEPTALALSVEQRGWWPVVMVEVETCWLWAGHRIVLRHIVPMLRSGRAQSLGSQIRFPCRGRYRLQEVNLASGFPLGLFTARSSRHFSNVAFDVLPRPLRVSLPEDLPVSEDESGQQVTRRLGHSTEMGILREYEFGDPVSRIHWRASARAGHLVIQQHLQSGSPMIRIVTEIPGADEIGRSNAPTEQALRAAAGVMLAAQTAGVRARVYLPPQDQALSNTDEVLLALARAEPGSLPLETALKRARRDLRDGELIVAVVGISCQATSLLRQLAASDVNADQVLVYVAAERLGAGAEGFATLPLVDALTKAGCRVLPVAAS
jgi:uncharacterized protein (DUF58 family)